MKKSVFFFLLLCNVLFSSCSSDDDGTATRRVNRLDTIRVASHVYTYSSEGEVRLAFYLKKFKDDSEWRVMRERLVGLDFVDGNEYVLVVNSYSSPVSDNGVFNEVVYDVAKILSVERKESPVGSQYTPFTSILGTDGSVRDTIIVASHRYHYSNSMVTPGNFLLVKPLGRGTWQPWMVLMENFTHEDGYEYLLGVDSRPIETGIEDYPSVACKVVEIIRKEQKETQVPNAYIRSGQY